MERVRASLIKYVDFRDKNAGFYSGLLRIYPLFVNLLRVLPSNGSIVVKPRDACIYLGICDHYTFTALGKLLSFFERIGLAKRLNNTRPKHYLLDHDMFSRVRTICKIEKGEDYCIETGCSLLGICPYWAIKQLRGDK
ncbi:MAG: hypothetical protein GXO43_01470 [Crenarchaeota archaeon]|nr:hypothetical protein [Thermoproteota archaeon]